MDKIVLFGGTFDPITIEHINIIKTLSNRQDVKKVIVIPTYLPPHKNASGSYFGHRLDMLNLALKGIKKVEISLFEIEQKRAVYSYETVTYFSEIYKSEQLCFAMGTDMLYIFSSWKNPEIIVGKAQIILFKRDGEKLSSVAIRNFENTFKKSVLVEEYISSSVSSTEIRVRNMLSLSLDNLTAVSVIEYIKQKNLYAGDRLYQYVNQVLPLRRRNHTAGVILCGLEFAKKLKLDSKKVEIACLLHDNAKYLNAKDYSGFTCEDMPKNVAHQFLGEYIAKTQLGIIDEEILSAIKYHTTAKANMTLMQKVVFLADVLEKNRTFEGVELLREITQEDFEKGFIASIKDLYLSLSEDKFYLTEQAFNYYVKGEK